MKAPNSPWHLARVCNRLALQGFGGILAVARHEFVEREQWLNDDEFLELLGTAQVLPGPNVINLALMLGEQCFGWRGIVAVLAGMLVVPGALALALMGLVLTQVHHPAVQGALRGMGLVAAGLLLGTCWKLLGPLRRTAIGPTWSFGLALGALALSAWWRWPLGWVVLGIGGTGMALAWRKLSR
jgi:chromate transporter